MKRTEENIAKANTLNNAIIALENKNEQLNKIKDLCNMTNEQKIVYLDVSFRNDEGNDFKSIRNVQLFTPKDIEALVNAKLKHNNANIESLTIEFEKL